MYWQLVFRTVLLTKDTNINSGLGHSNKVMVTLRNLLSCDQTVCWPFTDHVSQLMWRDRWVDYRRSPVSCRPSPHAAAQRVCWGDDPCIMTNRINPSLKSDVFPDSFKLAYVTPLLPDLLTNYRPVKQTLLSWWVQKTYKGTSLTCPYFRGSCAF